MFIKVYHSFGSRKQVQVTGHVFEQKPPEIFSETNFFVANVKALLSLFKVKVITEVELETEFFGIKQTTKSLEDGFFRFEFDSIQTLPFGWHIIKVNGKNPLTGEIISSEGKLFVPEINEFAIISDIDDTVMKSYSATVVRRLFELIAKNAYRRRVFENTIEWYKDLAKAHPPGSESRAFFYVSSSEWNLYEYLNVVFKKNELPEGIFLLNSLRTLKSFWKTGKTGHEGKLLRIGRLMNTFPEVKFVLIGDNTQKDPVIYEEIVTKYPNQVKAVLIRNENKKNASQATLILKNISQKDIPVLQFATTQEAISYSREIGIIK